MIDIYKIKVGDRVHYQPNHFEQYEWENGIVKELPGHIKESIRVVYNCNDEWHRYMDFTSALTSTSDLYEGWK